MLAGWSDSGASLVGALIGALVGGGSLWLMGEAWKKLRGVEAMGLGDVKMMFMVGAYLGWRLTILNIFLGALSGSLIGIVITLYEGRRDLQRLLPYGVYLGIGAIVALFFGSQIINWYAWLFTDDLLITHHSSLITILMRYGNRYQFGLTLLIGFFLLATFIAVLLYALTPATPATRGPLLLTAFVAILLGTLVCILFFLRWVLRPYRQLVGEAEKASAQAQPHKSQDEAEFVLETFQSVVAQLQEQRKALEQLSSQASKRADSAERFSERIVASVPSGLIAFDGTGHSMVINAPGRVLLEVDGSALGEPVATILRKMPQLAEMVEQCLQTGKALSPRRN